MLKVHNVTKLFGKKKAVGGVSFEINKGEIFSLIGPNSSGKTTIVKMIAGLLRPTSGRVEIDGIDVSKKPEKTKAKLGYIPDEPTVWPYMTGEEFLNFTQALFGIPEAKRKQNASKLLKIFKLQGSERDYFEDYSRGNRQKWSIIAAISHNPNLLLIDEPIVGLDPTGAEIAKKLFTDYAEKGGSILLVTHTLPVAQEISHRIGVLKDGKLRAVGTLAELRQKANLPENASLEEVYMKLA